MRGLLVAVVALAWTSPALAQPDTAVKKPVSRSDTSKAKPPAKKNPSVLKAMVGALADTVGSAAAATVIDTLSGGTGRAVGARMGAGTPGGGCPPGYIPATAPSPAGGQPVGPDSVGEIAVRSRYVAPGYWRRPDLTQAASLADSQGDSERTYQTGDLGRMWADGCLEFLGRKNFQLRIRGQWVEIAAIEKALRRLAALKDVVVLTLEDASSDEPRLVAYLVPGESLPPTIDELPPVELLPPVPDPEPAERGMRPEPCERCGATFRTAKGRQWHITRNIRGERWRPARARRNVA